MEGAVAGSQSRGVGPVSGFVCREDAEGAVVFGGELFAGLGEEEGGEEAADWKEGVTGCELSWEGRDMRW